MRQSDKNDREQHLNEISEISTAIMEREYVDRILKLIAPVAAKITGSKICTLFLVDKGTNELMLRASYPNSGWYCGKASMPLGKGIAGQVAFVGKVISISSIRSDRRFLNKRNALECGLHSALSVPMSVEGEVVGVINCYSSEERGYAGKEIQMLTEVVRQATVVIQNIRFRLMNEIVQQELEEPKILQRAKELIMEKKKISAAQVFDLIYQQSLKTHRSIAKIAESIVIASAVS
jgi:two-component system, response regulator PdtaR